MSLSKFTIYWDIENAGKYTATPQRQRTKNDLDAHGTFLDLRRIPGESNYSYFRRLRSVIPLRGGPHYEGLVHGITRDLGLEEKIGLKISPVSSGGKWIAPAPHVEITAHEVILYSSYTDASTYTVDTRIEIFDHGSAGYLLSDLVAQIQSSDLFVAELGSGMTGDEKSSGLFQSNSIKTMAREVVPPNSFFFLEHRDLVPGTLFFQEKDTFTTEISTALVTPSSSGMTISWAVSNLTSANGEYYVDYNEGIVTAHTSATGRGYCRYCYRDFPWYVRWSPIGVYSLRDENYREKVFEDETMLDNSTQHGLVSAEGVDVYTQVFERSPCLWGD